MPIPTITIAGRKIGPGHPAYVIAEMSGNHNQSFDHAVKIVRAAKDAGADAVKLQTYTADTITLDSDLPCFRVAEGTLWSGQTLYKLYQEAYTPWEWQPKLKQVAGELGMHCFSSPFDPTAVDFLEKMRCAGLQSGVVGAGRSAADRENGTDRASRSSCPPARPRWAR